MRSRPKALKAKNGNSVNIKFDTFYRLNDDYDSNIKFNSSQKQIIDLVLLKDKVLRKELVDISLSSLNTLIKKNVLIEEKVEHYRLDHSSDEIIKKELTSEQKNVVD